MGNIKKMSNQPKLSRPPCSTSADPLGVEDPLLKTSDLLYKLCFTLGFQGKPQCSCIIYDVSIALENKFLTK